YVYLSYGCHLCLNVVGQPGEAVLIRALVPEVGVEGMIRRRGTDRAIAAGPGRLGQALGIALTDSGRTFGEHGFCLEPGATTPSLLVGPRIGITKAADRPWRFGMTGVAGLSRSFPAA
ncbi:MAG TPA: DNA-3-methyladenine glycosylase, partial [Tabrizicola sp.]|nr:DNA-3-methyladenine glycosylase [Tabrizicola sp.]